MGSSTVLRILGVAGVLALLLVVGEHSFLRGRRAAWAEVSPPPVPVVADEPYLRVHLAGAVAKPGVYRLKVDDRVADALKLAGGARADARLDELNLAAKLRDGLRLYVPSSHDHQPDKVVVVTENIYVHEPPPPPHEPPAALPGDEVVDVGEVTRASKAKSGRSGKKQLPQGKIDLNTAGLEELQRLPGVGPAMAARIVAYRATVGRFGSCSQLKDVKGIGEKKYAKMAPYLTVGGP